MGTQDEKPLCLKLEIAVVIERDGETFHAYCPGLKGLHVDGETETEALKNATEAADCYVMSLIRHGDPLPIGPYLAAEHLEEVSPIPPGAMLKNIEVQCAIQAMSETIKEPHFR